MRNRSCDAYTYFGNLNKWGNCISYPVFKKDFEIYKGFQTHLPEMI